ncbi:MAG: DUF169 domain-containing protein [Dehalococcoidales bacterium]|nr:DUF169 domain-containing protein [Dehalococcoidales bacterium]
MTTVKEYKEYGKVLENLLHLQTAPIAVKMLKNEKDIPKGAIRPKRDRGYHLAQCQAFALTRRNRETIAMLLEDNWCWGPMFAYGLTKKPDIFVKGNIHYPAFISTLEGSKKLFRNDAAFKPGSHIGILSAPLGTASFKPDVVLIYCNPTQLRALLLSVLYKNGDTVTQEFKPFGSCVHPVVPVIQNGGYSITLPDAGEFQRALVREDELIFSASGDKIADLITGVKHLEEIKHGYLKHHPEMRPDFPRPDFYNNIFESWGLDTGGGTSCGSM